MDRGEVAVNAWLSCDSAYLAEVVGRCGFDSVTVDAQHGMLGREAVVRMLTALSATPAAPMVRVTAADPAEVGWCLDAGAYGVVVPNVEDAATAARVAAAARYPPAGRRSFGPARGLLHGGPDYVEHAGSEVMLWVMVESVAALGDLDAILSTPGVDGVYLGPNDLALDMGLAPGGRIEGRVARAADLVRERARAHGVRCGLFCADGEEARAWAERGYDLVTPGNDVAMVREAARTRVERSRGAGARPPGDRGGGTPSATTSDAAGTR